MEVGRRTVLAATVGALLGGCANQPRARQSRAASPPTTAVTVTPSGGPSAVPRWRPSPGDLEPACKRAAVRAVRPAAGAAGRTLQVIDVQYGGLLADTASVLVVTSLRTYDVRLSRRGDRWRVDAVLPSRPGPPGRISEMATEVLRHPRIDLPPAARRDVMSGLVHDTTLGALVTVARDFRVGVSVVRSGHPLYVFGTSRLSDHPQGRAFDTWEVDGRAVVDPGTSRQLVVEYMHAVAAAGSYNVGGPFLLGGAPQWFSDATHHDHVHAGFAT